MINKEKILVLGADGFIGSNLVKSLLKRSNTEVVAFDLFRNGKAKNLMPAENLTLFAGNFLNRNDIERAVDGIDYVFHFISLTTPGSSMDDPLIDVETNVKGSIVLLDKCAKAGVKRIIFPSSGGAIYGNQDKEKYSEIDQVNPISPYAISKLTIEKYLEYYKVHHGLDYLVLRYSNPYGPGQNIAGSQGIIPIFLNLIKQEKPINVFGDGNNIRDYIYIDDLIDITLKIYNKKNNYSIYNIGSGSIATINNVLDIIKEVVRKDCIINYLPDRDIDVKRVVLDLKRISNEIPNKKFIDLHEGIKRTWDWISVLQ
jgi:UDP-glucose 4-epimerase